MTRISYLALWLSVAGLALAGCGGGSTDKETQSTPAIQSTTVALPPTEGEARPAPRTPTAQTTTPSSLPLLVNHGPRTQRRIALTFDADMTQYMLDKLHSGAQQSWYDARIVNELRATGTPATIFLTGLWTETYPQVARQLASDPLFELDNHSVDHSGFEGPCYGLPIVGSSVARKRWEIEHAATVIERTAGRAPSFFRFPGGCHNNADVRLVAAAGERAIGWDVVSGDPFQPSSSVVVQNVLDGAKPGSIVVMHLNGAPNAPATAAALHEVIPALRARGFRFVTLGNLLSGCRRSGPARC